MLWARNTGRRGRRAHRSARKRQRSGASVAPMLAAAFASIALLPGLLTGTVADVKSQTPLPILLPATMKSDIQPLFASGVGEKKSYQIVVSSQEDCGAGACSLAFFSAYKGMKLYGTRRVTLTGGRKGRYLPLSCGGSCSPPSVQR